MTCVRELFLFEVSHLCNLCNLWIASSESTIYDRQECLSYLVSSAAWGLKTTRCQRGKLFTGSLGNIRT